MSHVATIQLQIRDPEALAAVCARLGLAAQPGQVRFYDGTAVAGTVIPLPGWRYPAVVDTQGVLHYDHYQGRWGELAELHRFRRAYTEEATTRWARHQGYRIVRQPAEDGTLRLELRR